VIAQFSRHAMAKTDLALALAAALKEIGSSLRVTVEVTVKLSDDSLPEPDLVITDFRGDGPVPGRSVVLTVEVADTTLDHDLNRMAVLYSAKGIGEYWVVDLERRVVHQHWSPSVTGYGERRKLAMHDPISAVTIMGLTVETIGLF